MDLREGVPFAVKTDDGNTTGVLRVFYFLLYGFLCVVVLGDPTFTAVFADGAFQSPCRLLHPTGADMPPRGQFQGPTFRKALVTASDIGEPTVTGARTAQQGRSSRSIGKKAWGRNKKPLTVFGKSFEQKNMGALHGFGKVKTAALSAVLRQLQDRTLVGRR